MTARHPLARAVDLARIADAPAHQRAAAAAWLRGEGRSVSLRAEVADGRADETARAAAQVAVLCWSAHPAQPTYRVPGELWAALATHRATRRHRRTQRG